MKTPIKLESELKEKYLNQKMNELKAMAFIYFDAGAIEDLKLYKWLKDFYLEVKKIEGN